MEFVSAATSVTEWLKLIKLDEYVDLFEMYMLSTVKQLQQLDDNTLKEMGIDMRGHRQRILTCRPESEFKERLHTDQPIDSNNLILFDDEVTPQDFAPPQIPPPQLPPPQLPPSQLPPPQLPPPQLPPPQLPPPQLPPPKLPPPQIPPRVVLQIPPRPPERPVEPQKPVQNSKPRPVPIPRSTRPVTMYPISTTPRPVPRPRKPKSDPINGNAERNTHFVSSEIAPQLPERPISDGAPPHNSAIDLSIRPVPKPPIQEVPFPKPPIQDIPVPKPSIQDVPVLPPRKPSRPPSFIVAPPPDDHPHEPSDFDPFDLPPLPVLLPDNNICSKFADDSEEYSTIQIPSNPGQPRLSGINMNGDDGRNFNHDSEEPYDTLWPSNADLKLPADLPEIVNDDGVYSVLSDEPDIHPPPLPEGPPPQSPTASDDDMSSSESVDEYPPHNPSTKPIREGTLKRFQETLDGKSTTNEKSGILSKQGGKQGNRGVQKRFVKFDGKSLRYYENEKKTSFSKKVIPVGAMRDVDVQQATSALKNNTLSLRTINRVYVFSHESMEVLISWSLTLMKAIVEHPKDEYPIGGEMNNPDKEGYMKIDECRLYVAAKSGRFCYYKNKPDFDAGTPISDICMNTSSCRELPKNKLQLHTPYRTFMFTLDSPEETNEWFNIIKETITDALADKAVLNAIQKNIDNKFCADCGTPEPDWSTVNFGVIICKTCSGAHRKLQFNVKSVKMDINVWTPALQEIMITVGNKINAFWEARLENFKKPKPDASVDVRKEFIERKYKYRMFCKSSLSAFSGQEELDNELCRVASRADCLYQVMTLLFSGARFRETNPEVGMSALEIARHANIPSIMEIFHLNKDSDFTTQRPPPRYIPGNTAEAPSIPVHTRRDTDEDRKSGYLFKTGVGRKEFQRRYCRLENGTFSYSVDEKSPYVKNTIEGIDIQIIGESQPRPGNEHCFEMGVVSGRSYLFSAESAEEKQEWMYIIAKFLTPQVMWSYLSNFDLVGHLHKKEGSTSTDWRRLTFLLKGKKLSFFSAEKDCMEDLDLRKLTNSYVDNIGPDERQTVTEQTICLCFPDKSRLYLRSENKEHSDRWHTAIQNTLFDCGTSLENQPLTKENVPVIVNECIRFVEKNALKTEGVYRLAGVKSKVNQILQNLYHNAREVRLTLDEDYIVHDVTSALKQYFRELDDPLLTSDLYNQWVKNSASQDNASKIRKYAELVKELPEVNRNTLKELIIHLNDVSDNKQENKMETKNLAAVFGPTLMSGKNSVGGFGAANYEISVIGDLMLNYAAIFEVTQEEQNKLDAKRIFLARLSENQLLPPPPVKNDMHVTLYIGPKSENENIDVQISESMTTSELIQTLIDTNKINMPPSQVSVFEVICNGELERVFNPHEKILAEILSWDDGMRSDNYICIKSNYLEKKIEKYLTLVNASSQVTFCGKKKIKKAYFEVTGMDVKCYKDKKLDKPVYSSKVSDIVFYFGVEKKIKSSKFGFTFIDRKEDPVMLRAVLVDTEEDVYYWLGCLLNTKRQCTEGSNNNVRTVAPIPPTRTRSPFKDLLGFKFHNFAFELKDRANKFAVRRMSKIRSTYRASQSTRNRHSSPRRPEISNPGPVTRPIPESPDLNESR
ncbi:arf-GAP with Rho-GAP domain, ANK repeat and PH domain-containing protein 1-like isoform X2 [Antedon mediterranea]|uniref:arf-GAP with Rho-GAP domain, ANK repeat and PH domain-containing protein 1-like isoform X2 n=1 Tax=Antedon mediterranea TaxID=105859 RepID=UPI003AF51954